MTGIEEPANSRCEANFHDELPPDVIGIFIP